MKKNGNRIAVLIPCYNMELMKDHCIHLILKFFIMMGKNIIISNNILVSTFPTVEEVNDLKVKDSYRKVS